ncbi:MAG: dephospho-CoA kinase [Elusimicrobiota bacterium]
MLIAALTGGMGTGKSVALKIFQELGCYVHSADKEAHSFLEPGTLVWEKIVEHFGKKILNKNNTIDRRQLGKIIFRDKKERQFLNNLIHPLVMKKKQQLIDQLEKQGKYKIFISESAIVIEAGYRNFYDKIIVTSCDKDTQIKRIMERDHISKAEALKKIKSQLNVDEKSESADYVINTSGPFLNTIDQAERVFRNLMKDYELKLVN